MEDILRARDAAGAGYGSTNARPRYLLSGLLVCSECGRAMTLVGGKGQKNVCATNHAGGNAACRNRLGVTRLLAEELVLIPIKERLLSERAVAETVAELQEIAAGRRQPVGRAPKADPRIAELRRMVRMGAMSEAEAHPTIQRHEAASKAKVPLVDVESLARSVEARAKALRAAIERKAVAAARTALRGLVGSIRCVPTPSASGAYLMTHFENDPQPLALSEWLSGLAMGWESALVAWACLGQTLSGCRLSAS